MFSLTENNFPFHFIFFYLYIYFFLDLYHIFPPLNFIHLQTCTCCAAVCYLGRDKPIPDYSQLCYIMSWVCKCLGGWEPCETMYRLHYILIWLYEISYALQSPSSTDLICTFKMTKYFRNFSEPSLLMTMNEGLQNMKLEELQKDVS